MPVDVFPAQMIIFTVDMILGLELTLIGIFVECFLYGKISVLCFNLYPCQWSPITIPRSRTLFRDIRHVSKMPIGQVQEGNHRFLCSLSSPHSIHWYRCQWFSNCHNSNSKLDTNPSKLRSYLLKCHFLISCAATWYSSCNKSHYNFPNLSKRSLWLHRSMYYGTLKPLYLSELLFLFT